ncbi:putative immunoglobulin [Trypoxylus dichotomus]
MMKTTVLIVVAVWISFAGSRRLSTRSVWDNEIDLADSREANTMNWVIVTPPKAEINVTYGAGVMLVCQTVGSPPLTIEFDNNPNTLSRKAVFSKRVEATTPIAVVKARLPFIAKKAEVISCKGTSGKKISHFTFKVFVSGNKTKDVPKRKAPMITYFYESYMDIMGSTVIFPCKAVGAGKVIKTWQNATEFEMSNNNDSRVSVLSSGELIIRNITWADMGIYICIAKNAYGHDNITTFLYPLAKDNATTVATTLLS